jgi:homocysteine S-methyltransferase
MNPLDPFLDRFSLVMLDGGLATELEAHGANLDSELWSAKLLIDSPELIRKVHEDFLAAGADIIATATYQASFEGFERAGYDRAGAENLMRLAVDLALIAREAFWSNSQNHLGRLRPLVAASIGPYGACLHDGSEYSGDYGLDQGALEDFHRPRMNLLAGTEADVFAFETIPSLLEARALIKVLGEFPDKRALLSFSCSNDRQVSHGEPFVECAELAKDSSQILAVGVNCLAPEWVTPLLESASGIGLPLMAYPNSGETWDADAQEWMGDVCRDLPVLEWHERGARVIGGCCRTLSADIRRMRDVLLASQR